MGSGPKITTTSTNTQNSAFVNDGRTSNIDLGQSSSQNQSHQSNQSASTTTPNLPDWYMQLKQNAGLGFSDIYHQLGQQAQKPLYGAPQQAAFQETLNRQLGGARQDLLSQLASSGALNSGRADQAQTGLALGGVQQMQNYLSQVPLLNAQYKQGLLGQQLGVLNGAAGMTIPYGQTTNSSSIQDLLSNLLSQYNNSSNGTSNQTGTSNQSSNGVESKQQSGGLLNSILGGLVNAGMGFLSGGLTNVLGGNGFIK